MTLSLKKYLIIPSVILIFSSSKYVFEHVHLNCSRPIKLKIGLTWPIKFNDNIYKERL